ncbi:MAG: hypothetical protein WDM70_11295 [Nitrosomonadales bacterium]
MKKRIFLSAVFVLGKIGGLFPDFIDEKKTAEERATAWANGYAAFAQELGALPYQEPLTQTEHQKFLEQAPLFLEELAPEVASSKNTCTPMSLS